jgi:uncharacterized protein YsxB (DUF464 family)
LRGFAEDEGGYMKQQIDNQEKIQEKMEYLRDQLNKLMEQYNEQGSHQEILSISRVLDGLIVEYMKEQM